MNSNSPTLRLRTLRFAPTVLVLLLALSPLGCCKKCPETLTGGGAVHDVYIRADASDPGRCVIVDGQGNSDVTVEQGQYVRWNNEMGADIQLTFGGVKRLFGVLKAVSHGDGQALTLQVRNDAAVERHGYTSSCGAQMPGPGIIVCPPGGC